MLGKRKQPKIIILFLHFVVTYLQVQFTSNRRTAYIRSFLLHEGGIMIVKPQFFFLLMILIQHVWLSWKFLKLINLIPELWYSSVRWTVRMVSHLQEILLKEFFLMRQRKKFTTQEDVLHLVNPPDHPWPPVHSFWVCSLWMWGKETWRVSSYCSCLCPT